MIGKTRKLLERKLNDIENQIANLDYIKIQNGKILSQINKQHYDSISQNIQLAEFKVFSQWGDDGIIQFLIDYLDIDNKVFIEFGVENYKEANTRYLLINNNWKGLIMDGSEEYMKQVKSQDYYWQHSLMALPVFVTRENINSLIKDSGFSNITELLHIDIDGNDYWVWEEINCIQPTIAIIEYNSVLGVEKPWVVEYKSDFFRTTAHHSNLYYGASLLALCDLAEKKGYSFIGSNSNGNNAYFIRKDKLKGLKVLEPKLGYVESMFRESRDEKGNLTFISGADRLAHLKGKEIYNTRTQSIEII